MLTKDKVRKTIDRLPENFTVDQIVEELVILNRIEEGLKDIEEGRVFTTDQVKKELKTWLKYSGLNQDLQRPGHLDAPPSSGQPPANSLNRRAVTGHSYH
jgi:predicted transcriptional regulator